jgi:hypothetical protein
MSIILPDYITLSIVVLFRRIPMFIISQEVSLGISEKGIVNKDIKWTIRTHTEKLVRNHYKLTVTESVHLSFCFCLKQLVVISSRIVQSCSDQFIGDYSKHSCSDLFGALSAYNGERHKTQQVVHLE